MASRARVVGLVGVSMAVGTVLGALVSRWFGRSKQREVSAAPYDGSTDVDAKRADELLDFLLVVGQLKTEKRTGWQYMKVPAPESVADHMYRMAIMALVIGDCAGDGFEKERAMKIALCHDMSEALCGDITPSDNVSKQEKNHLETEAMEHIRGVLTGKPGVGQELLDLWSEYEYQSSPESKYVKDFDKLEMCIQAFEYESVHADIDLSEFYESTQSKLKVPLMQTMFARLLERRKAIKHSA